ncbi:MAG: hypothetical protein F6K31_39995 [Symploca sp. SIO2G7]|nr:hypothetical protein [Symploca sp. SIO2G7]
MGDFVEDLVQKAGKTFAEFKTEFFEIIMGFAKSQERLHLLIGSQSNPCRATRFSPGVTGNGSALEEASVLSMDRLAP